MISDGSIDLNELGITRLAEQGTLDTLGLSVWAAIRPAARSLVVTNGKGTNSVTARCCAVMEAFECFCAEDWERLTVRICSLAELISEGQEVINFGRFLKCDYEKLDVGTVRHWVKGTIAGQETVLLPYELVGLDMTVPSKWDRNCFNMNSVGLAAHTDRDRAISAALLEVIENDARAIATALPKYAARLRRFDPASLNSNWVKDVRQKLAAESQWAELVDITTDIGFPTVLCIIRSTASGSALQMRHAGSACRGTYETAAEAALMEAIQSRVTHIAGARDDINLESFTIRHTSDVEPNKLTPIPASNDAASFPAPKVIQKELASAGVLGVPIICDLSPAHNEVHCVSALIPDLEIVPSAKPPVVHGPRLAKYALRQLVS